MQTEQIPVKPKRGRRSKRDIELAAAAAAAAAALTNESIHAENVVPPEINIKLDILAEENEEDKDNEKTIISGAVEPEIVEENEVNKKTARKRGRKPKGGKIVQVANNSEVQMDAKPNVILHLKCSTKDLQSTGYYDSNFSASTIESFHLNNSKNEMYYDVITPNICNSMDTTTVSADTCITTTTTTIINPANNTNTNINATTNINTNANTNFLYNDAIDEKSSGPMYCSDSKDIWKKLKVLEQNLHMNNISDKKSACFWCSYDFDNLPIYIPKHYIKDSYHVYGCFCSPECAVAHLMEENIDSSIKFERYYLLNHIYSKIYNYTKNIKPAPNPHYMLEKFYGNLSIQEYRALLNSERLFLIVDKPLTRILPEFHEDNDDFIINNKIIPSNNYQMKKNLTQQQKKVQTKNTIMSEKFGFASVCA